MKKIRNLFSILLIITITLTNIIPSNAHQAVFLEVLIDAESMMYRSNTSYDRPSFYAEDKHSEARLGDFTHMKIPTNFSLEDAVTKPTVKDETRDSSIEFNLTEGGFTKGIRTESSDGDEGMVFTFPSKEQNDVYGKKNDAGNADADRAYVIANMLVPSLNEALLLINGKSFKTTEELINLSMKIRSSGAIPGTNWSIRYGTDPTKVYNHADDVMSSKNGGNYEYDCDTDGNYYATLISSTGERASFVYMMPKGYIPTYDRNEDGRLDQKDTIIETRGIDYAKLKMSYMNQLANGSLIPASPTEDTAYISWTQLSSVANYAYVGKGYSAKNPASVSVPNAFERLIIGMLENLLNGLRNLLGLYSLDELIFNKGVRGSKLWQGGMMNSIWWEQVLKYHLIFQAIAWLLIGLAIVKALIETNLSTINPAMKVDLMDLAQNLLITGFVLLFILPIINWTVGINNALVKVFATQLPVSTTLSGYNAYGNWLAGFVLSFFYLIIDLYMNFSYIIRSLTLAILIASAPIFIVSLAFGGRIRGLFDTWSKEMIANVFMQTFHAFALAFFFSIQTGARGIESLVVAYALIPLTEFFKGMLVGGAGGFVHKQAERATEDFSRFGQGAVATAGAGAMAGVAGVKGLLYGSRQGERAIPSREESINTGEAQSSPLGGGQAVGRMPSYNNIGIRDSSALQERSRMMREQGKGQLEGVQKDKEERQEQGFAWGEKARSVGLGLAKGTGNLALAGANTGIGLAIGNNSYFGNAGKQIGKAVVQAGSVAKQGLETGGYLLNGGIQMARQFQTSSSLNKDTNNIGGLQSGDMEITSSLQQLQSQGIGNISRDANSTTISYNLEKLRKQSPNDYTNIQQYQSLQDNGKEEELKTLGIERVGKSRNGEVMVSYNRTGLENMGRKSILTEGNNALERNAKDSPKHTNWTVPVHNVHEKTLIGLDDRY